MYPNPDLIVRPTSAPPGFPPQMTSRDGGKLYPIHSHCAFINRDGTGTTDVMASHFHRVSNGVIQGDQSDGHTHRLTGLPCGAG